METSEAHSSHDLDDLLNKLSLHTGHSDLAENYHHLKVIFDVIRQHASFEEAVKFNEMLPLPFKAIFLDGWQISSRESRSFKSIDQVAEIVVRQSDHTLSTVTEARQLLRKVFTFLGQQTSPGQMREGLSFLPSEFRALLLQDPNLRYTYSDTCIWLS
ncbi:DUF2267 domain-containing protein [Tunicatimonas pelagia]|uniref:DUF2267 domain-containing protein n=1 Tax=Tunicatimonas pelagia TaxID=931531 RepID=UPI002666C1EE|nr:DUF2267 domain-containing protein [Tunicatimonas pelagia]WKN43861.1 DUF2267 domain-containing protein [Tunicatimonas pelagia]